jgi:hypothetical protein
MNSFVINLFEELGNAHNEGIDYVVANLVLGTMLLIDEIIRLSSQFACRQLRLIIHIQTRNSFK